MLNRFAFGCAAVMTCLIFSSPALGQRNPASKANLFQSSLVQGVSACTAANTTLPGAEALPGCDPVVPADAVCNFTDKGFGRLKFKAKDDVKIQVKIKGLSAACNAEVLCVVADMRWTQDGCASGGSCTTEELDGLPLGASCCTVGEGNCRIKTSLVEAFNDQAIVVNGNRTEYALGSISIVRVGHFPDVTFRAGLMVP